MKHFWWARVEEAAFFAVRIFYRLHLAWVLKFGAPAPRLVSWANHQCNAVWHQVLRKWRQSI